MTNQEKNTVASLIRQEYGRMLGYIRNRIDDRAEMDAEDIIQEVALNLYTRIDFQEPVENLVAYIYRSVRNKIIDIQRKRSSSLQMMRDDETSRLQVVDTGNENSTEDMESIYNAMYEVLLEMEPGSRDLILATELGGVSFREISEKTGIPVGTLLSRKHRALATLQKKLKESHPRIWDLYYNQ